MVNAKLVARLLKAWGFLCAHRKIHHKAQGRPFNITRSNELWQTDMTSTRCGEDGWRYFTAVIDCFDRSIIGWSFTNRYRAKDFSPGMTMAWGHAFPQGQDSEEEITVTLRHDNGTQFISEHLRKAAKDLGIKLSRTSYRRPDGNAFIERVFRTLKEEAVWPNDTADSTGRRNELSEPLRWCHIAEGLAWTPIETALNCAQLRWSDGRKVHALGQVLAQ